MRSRILAATGVAVAAAVAVPFSAAAAVPAATTWTGWDAPGPIGVGTPVQVTARGGTTVVVGNSVRDEAVGLAVTSPEGSRVGRVPVNVGDGRALRVALQRPGRALLADRCRVRFSDDRGLTWGGDPLPGCTSGETPSVTVATDSVSYAWLPTRTWRSTDGGQSWTSVNGGERGPDIALDANRAVRIVGAGPGGAALQRTDDGGVTWTGVKVPGPGGPPAPLVDSLPSLAGLSVRPGNGLLVGAGGVLLVSYDGGQTFTRVAAPIPDDLPGAASVTIYAVICDASGACVVGVQAPDGRRSGLRFDGGAFGARVAAPPVVASQSPAAGTIVGLADSLVVRTTDLGATPYKPFASSDAPGSLGVHGLVAIAKTGRLHVSSDHGASWSDVALPETPEAFQVASAGGALIALADDGTLLQLEGGSWKKHADLNAIKPRGLAVAGATPIVVGARGVVRLTDPASPKPIRSTVLAGRGFNAVAAKGKVVVAWNSGVAVRSADGGKTWRRSSMPKGIADVQIVSSKLAYAVAGNTLYRSANGAKSFKRLLGLPDLGNGAPGGDSRAPSIEFTSAKAGTIITSRGGFYTRDGGKHVAVLPTPGSRTPAAASVFGNGAVIQDEELGSVFRSSSLFGAKPPKLTLVRSGSVRKGKGGRRTIKVVGILDGAVSDGPVSVLSIDRRGATVRPQTTSTLNADGSFRVTITLGRSERGLQAWYRGAVRPTGTSLGATSKVLTVK